MKNSYVVGICCACVLVVAATTSQAAVIPLQSRLGGQAYYDANLDVTWAADSGGGGLMFWDDANTWLSGLTIGGIGGWRLPNADVNGDDIVESCHGGAPCADNELGFIFNREGITPATPGPFTNVLIEGYSTSTEHVLNTSQVWAVGFGDGANAIIGKFKNAIPWPVHDGDVAVVPKPTAIALFGPAGLCLAGLSRRRVAG